MKWRSALAYCSKKNTSWFATDLNHSTAPCPGLLLCHVVPSSQNNICALDPRPQAPRISVAVSKEDHGCHGWRAKWHFTSNCRDCLGIHGHYVTMALQVITLCESEIYLIILLGIPFQTVKPVRETNDALVEQWRGRFGTTYAHRVYSSFSRTIGREWSCTLDLFRNSWVSQDLHLDDFVLSPSGRMLVMVTIRMARASLPMRDKRKSTGFTGRLEAHKMVISTMEVVATWAM